ncbi:nitrite reductase (NAD(P)H) small subunit [Sphingomonas oleivorans]|uniref:Nitrite reductase (NAD(P)H) small subunit n=1 Tax=Sphingomonas oleivorans TaxID=1735121 RepID=A0A2T5FXX3_9SPHN|nr:nitrite reductase small subunit NirD [Sphingomonas oleivorans]PTQ10979.1 nitrite reductase (NAD(P)H) small subunit [Sphingomonas oleivorans]
MTQWIDVGAIADIPRQGARTVALGGHDPIAIFRTLDDRIFALVDRCPHKHGPLSQGIVHGHAVSCPLHNWKIALATGEAQDEDKGCTPTIPLRLEADRILIGVNAGLATAA